MAHMIELGPVPPNIRQYNLFQTIYPHSLAKKVKKSANLGNFEKKKIHDSNYFICQVLPPSTVSGPKFSLYIWHYL